MAVEQTRNQLADATLDQLPRKQPVAEDIFGFRSIIDGVTYGAPLSSILPGASTQNFEWVANKQPMYGLNESVTFGGTWYKSLSANNTGIPGQSGTWQAMSQGSVSGGFYKPGVYAQEKVVVYSDHTGITEQYQLTAPARPFVSTNIATEEEQGLWVSISGQLRRVYVSVVANQLVLDCKHQSQIVFIVEGNISNNTTVVFENHDKLVWCKIRFVIAAPVYFQLPTNTISSDVLFNQQNDFRKQFLDIGPYSMEVTYDEVNFWIETFGPGRGSANLPASLLNLSIANVGGTLVATRQYYDAEGDLENNPPPILSNVVINGLPEPEEQLTITYDFYSPFGYAEGVPVVQWYRKNEDGTNRTAIPGANSLIYNVSPIDDTGYLIEADVIGVQVAAPPANGNPNSIVYTTNALLIQEPQDVGPEPLVLEDHFDHILNLFDDNYDAGTFSIPDTGLRVEADTWTSPASTERPTYDAVNKRLRFDPTVTPRYIDAPIAASNAKGSSGTKKYDFVGVVEFAVAPTSEFQIFAILTNMNFRLSNLFFFTHQTSSTVTFNTFVAEVGVKYRFRLRIDTNAGTGNWEGRLQLNYDEDGAAFLYDATFQGTNGGATIPGGSTIRLGASKQVPVTRALNGWIYEFALLGQAHLDAQYELNLWRRLNLVAGIA